MTIDFNRSELESLIRAAHAGIHVFDNDRMEALEKKIAAAAAEEDVDVPLDRIHDEIDTYDDDRFWDRLAHDLGERDLEESSTEEEIETMDDAAYEKAVDECARIYDQEFDAHGIDRLGIDQTVSITRKG